MLYIITLVTLINVSMVNSALSSVWLVGSCLRGPWQSQQKCSKVFYQSAEKIRENIKERVTKIEADIMDRISNQIDLLQGELVDLLFPMTLDLELMHLSRQRVASVIAGTRKLKKINRLKSYSVSYTLPHQDNMSPL